MLENRSSLRDFIQQNIFDTIGLVQGKLAETLAATDIAEKASAVNVLEVQSAMIAIFGDAAAVAEAIESIKTQFEKG